MTVLSGVSILESAFVVGEVELDVAPYRLSRVFAFFEL